MIILKLEEAKSEKRNKIRVKKKSNEILFNYTRAGLIINNKPHFVISVNESNLCDENFKALLKRYKGEIITSEKLAKYDFLNDLLFDEKPYLKKALFQNFIKLINNEKSKKLNVFVSDLTFDLKDELPLILPGVKSLTVRVADDFLTRDWQRKCFYEYGVKPRIVTEKDVQFLSYEVIADFDKIQNKTIIIEFFSEQKTIYPDCRFLEIPNELKFLENFDLDDSTICAVFGSILKK